MSPTIYTEARQRLTFSFFSFRIDRYDGLVRFTTARSFLYRFGAIAKPVRFRVLRYCDAGAINVYRKFAVSKIVLMLMEK